jgi:putative transposase
MIILEDRQKLAHDINTAHQAGARLRLACAWPVPLQA